MWGLLIVVALWVLVAPIIALVLASGARRRADDLARRLESLEALVRSRTGPPSAPKPEAPAETPAEPARPATAAPPPETAAPTEAAEPEIPEPTEPELAEPEPVAAPPPSRPRESLETKIGARWTVFVGGLALALGAVFLVRYTIEQGLLGPGMRVALGALLSAVLFAAGEWLRRRDRALPLPVFQQADVPAILTAAGGVAAFATVYAAHALYGFVSAGPAFVLLTAAGLVTLVLSVVHGPALAALGAVGSYAAPLLVASTEPNPLAIAIHTLAVTAAVLGMARIRGWRWLAIAGVAASIAWGLLLGRINVVETTAAELILAAGLAVVYVAALVAETVPATLRDRTPDPYGIAALTALAALALYFADVNARYPALPSGIVLAGLLGAVAGRWTSVAWAAVIAGVVAIATVMLLPAALPLRLDTFQIGDFEWYVLDEADIGGFALKAAAIGLLVGLGSFLTADRAARPAPRTAGLFAAAGAGAPLLILVVFYLRHSPFETRPVVGLAALVMAAIFAAMTERLIAHRPEDDVAPAPALYAAGAVLALSFAFAVGLATRFIPLALSLGAAGIVWVSLFRPVRLLGWLAVVAAGLACVAVVFGPPFTPAEIGTRPILNGLILRLGLPALAVLLAGEVLRRRRDGIEAHILQTIGLVFAAFFVVTEIRHFANHGVINAGEPGLGEQGALTLAALAFSLGLQRIGRQTGSVIYRNASLIAGVLGAGLIAVTHFVTANPLVTGEPVGTGRIVNLLLPGYLLPALGAAWVAAAARHVRPRWYVLMMSALSLALAFAYLTLMVRHGFHGSILDRGGIEDAENWTYSAVWLAFGIALLAAGIMLRSTMVRAASGIVIALVVCKVFLFDMSALTGALRAASFLGLGATLIVIGRLYQRLLLSGPTEEEAPT